MTSFGPYRVIRELGRGATAVVYEVVDAVDLQHYALKHLLDSTDLAQLKAEFRVARTLSHPNVVRLHELFELDGDAFFTMELVPGIDLVSHCRAHPESIEGVFRELAGAVDHLHRSGLVHRDLKPSNIQVDARSRVVLLDFGLTRRAAQVEGVGFSGSPLYAAPERLLGAAASQASDWYSFGVVLLEAFTEVPATLVDEGLRGAGPTLPALPGAPPRLVALIRSLLAADPAQRGGRTEVLAGLGGRPEASVSAGLVGRADDLAWLRDALASAGAVAVVGPAGTGKSDLVRHATQGMTGRLVVRSRCHPREMVPFNALDDAWAELARGTGATDANPPRTVAELVSGVADHIRRLATPPILWVDDAQWADEDSVRVISELLSRPDLPLTVVFTVRGDLAGLPFPTPSRVRVLAPLDLEAGLTLLETLAPGLGAPRASALVALAGGRPLWIRAAADWARTHAPLAELPAGDGELLLGTVSGEPSWLGLLAVHPRGVELEVLAESRVSLAGAGWDLVDAGLLEFHQSGGRRSVALHPGMAEALLARASPASREGWHRTLARAFAEVRPHDADAQFVHHMGAGEPEAAAAFALPSARQLRDVVALYAAARRYRWAVEHGPADQRDTARFELAEVLGRAGEGLASGELFEELARTSPTRDLELRRRAAEQYLRAGFADRGRRLLEECLTVVGVWIPESLVLRGLLIAWYRLCLELPTINAWLARFGRGSVDDRLETAWSAGLGLNLLDVTASTVAQGCFTALALSNGSPSHVARAHAVEYSFARFGGLPGSARRVSGSLRALQELSDTALGPYDRGFVQLSWAAGELFGGDLAQVVDRARAARTAFSASLGAKSWEIACCEMYGSWAALELDLSSSATRVLDTFQATTSRGDRAYRQCFVAGPCAVAWLAAGRCVELERLLVEVAPPPGAFGLPQFLALLGRHRLLMFQGRSAEARAHLSTSRAAIAASGMERLRWPDLCFGIARGQAALTGDDPTREVARIATRLRSWDHPAATPWAEVLCAATGPAPGTAFESAADRFTTLGFHTTARAFRHQAARLRGARAWDHPHADALGDSLAVTLR